MAVNPGLVSERPEGIREPPSMAEIALRQVHPYWARPSEGTSHTEIGENILSALWSSKVEQLS